MILTCDQCQTNYMVTPAQIPDEGRKVKCVKCGHVWHQVPQEDEPDLSGLEPEPTGLNDIPEGGSLPVVSNSGLLKAKKALKIGSFVALAAILVVGFVFKREFLVENFKFTKSLYDMVGFYDSVGVTIEDLTMQQFMVRDRTNYLISGKIANNTGRVINVPHMRLSLLKEDKSLFHQIDRRYIQKEIEDGKFEEFHDTLTNIPQYISYILIDLGNPIDLQLRSY